MAFNRLAPALVALATAGASVACAGILGIDSGIAESDGGSEAALQDSVASEPANDRGSNDAATAPYDVATTPYDVATAPPDGPIDDDAPSVDADRVDAGCSSGQKSCSGSCVSTGDPTYGCTPTGCSACNPVPNATLSCAGKACAHVCDQGYVDCAGQLCSCGAGNRCLSDNTCGPCRATLQPCQVGSDCCSGTCGGTLTCL